VRSSSRSSRAGALGLAAAIAFVAGGSPASAHRTDEYLQAARIAIDPGRVDIALDLTAGIAVAPSILADIDRNGDGSLSAAEQRSYARSVLAGLELEIDGRRWPLTLGAFTFPSPAIVKRGEGTIRLQFSATFPPVSAGSHRLFFRNLHHPRRSVYLANALVPESDRVSVSAQHRDKAQVELTIEYLIRAATSFI
jgi:hypothetical protein